MVNRYCPQCGKENLNNSNFCSNCGADLRGAPADNSFNNAPQQPQPQQFQQPQQFNNPINNQYGAQLEGYEEVVRLRRRSPATVIVPAAIMLALAPLFIWLISWNYAIGVTQDQWVTFYFLVIFVPIEYSVIQPLVTIFSAIRLVKLNNLAKYPILYNSARNTFAFPRGNFTIEVYAKDIVSFNRFGGILKLQYYQNGLQQALDLGWVSPDVCAALDSKLYQARNMVI